MELFRPCQKCDASGIWNSMPCDHCGGTGYWSFGEIGSNPGSAGRADFHTHEILEATVGAEYNALSDANKDAYVLIISCGIINLTDGNALRAKLWNMFDDQSTTRANLITLLGE